MLDDYLNEADRHLERSTMRNHRAAVKILKRTFGSLRIADLKASVIREWIKDQSAGARRIRNMMQPLNAIVARALNDDLISEDPLAKVKLKDLLSKNQKAVKTEPDPFDIDEMRDILRACRPGHERNFWQFAFWSGLRTSELIALQWEHIDLRRGVVMVREAYVYGEKKGTKTTAGNRDVILLPLARAALETQKALTYIQHEHVFFHPKLLRPWADDQQIRKGSWSYLLKKAGVRYRKPYATRHTFISMLLSQGENELFVAQQAGHANVAMIRQHYGKWIEKAADDKGYQFRGNYKIEMKGNE
jgi:integrase